MSDENNELNELRKEIKTLERKLKEANYLVSSYEQYSVFQKSLYESLKKQKDEQDTYLRLVFSNTPDIVFILSSDAAYVIGTKKSIDAIGINADALSGRTFPAIFAPVMTQAWIDFVSQNIHKALATGTAQKLPSVLTTINGKDRSYEINIIPFCGESGGVGGVIVMMHDETDLHELVLAAESSNRAKTRFLAKISHEIRTPMNAIAGMSEFILRANTSSLVREHALNIKQASNNLMSVINDVLDFSKIESGKLEIVESEYDFSALLNDVISIIRARVIDKQIFFVANADADIPKILIGDEIRIRQILLNLLSNAFKYCERGFISLHVGCEKLSLGNVILTFDTSDSGVGIRSEEVEKLFLDFSQLDRVTNKGIEGTGLGLVITKNLCEAMGGSISVYSSYGKGSTFTARIPQKFGVYKKYAEVANPSEKRVIVYETRAAYSMSVVCSVDTLGVECTLVTTQNEFLNALNKHKYTHVFVSSFLRESAHKIVTMLCPDAALILLAEYGNSYAYNENSRVIEMPAQTLVIANILNGEANPEYAETRHGGHKFIAPSARILIVDDLITNLRVAEGLMLPYRMQIDVCRSGREAIELANANDYDMIFMDHMMPEMDGVEATLAIRALDRERFAKLPIIALTANAVAGVREMLLQYGFNDFLAKPVDLAKLNQVLETYLPKEKIETYTEVESEDALPVVDIPGIDLKSGIYMTGGNTANYLRVLSAFKNDGADKMNVLRESAMRGNMKKYSESAHAIKGASASVGASKLSSLAKALELAAKNEDADYVRKNNDLLMDELETLLENIARALAAHDKHRDKTNIEPKDTDRFAKLKNALDEFDIEAADALIASLHEDPWDEDVTAALDRIANRILLCEYDEARDIANRLASEFI